MELESVHVTLQFLQCTFCGTLHCSTDEVRDYGCNRPAPEQQIHFGKIVMAGFPRPLPPRKGFLTDDEFQEALDRLGENPFISARCRVTEVRRPVDVGQRNCTNQPLSLKPGKDYYRNMHDPGFLIVHARTMPHNWMAFVEPLEQPLEGVLLTPEWRVQSALQREGA